MARDGNGVYSAPAGTTAVSTTTISSSAYNTLVADLVANANEARPISAGGTGQASFTGVQNAFKIAPYDSAATITGNWDFTGTVTGAVGDGEVTSAKIAAAGVAEANIADGAVSEAKIADGAVASAKIADDAVVTSKIADGAVATDSIAAAAVTVDKIASGVIGSEFATPVDPAGAETNFDFAIPAGVTEIFVHIRAATPSEYLSVKLGTAGGIIDTGYYGSSGAYFGNATKGSALSTQFFANNFSTGAASGLSYVFRLVGSNIWAGGGAHGRAGNDNGTLQGGVELGAELTTVRIASTDLGAFSAGGKISVGWRK